MNTSEIVDFLRAQVEPLGDDVLGKRYRAAAHLRDGTYLPCVVFQSERRRVDLALKRFKELKDDADQYRMVLGSFLAGGSSVADYDLSRIALSPYAWPLDTLRRIHGETTMGWTAFVVEMNDRKRFSYGTSFRFEFFDLPAGYTVADIKEIYSEMVHSDSEGTQPFNVSNHAHVKCLRERPFFTCYLEDLDE